LTREEYIKEYYSAAVITGIMSKVLPSVTMAQAIIESGNGNSTLAKEPHNNHFGIKAHGNPNYVVMPTQEFVNGQYITINSQFRTYPSARASYKDHIDFLKENDNYKQVFKENDYIGQTNALKAAGYATSPTYAYALQKMIEDNNLDKMDWVVRNRMVFFCHFQGSCYSSFSD
jgi:flagellum-specific peptidoglycan hydrolase FlgJ